MLTPEQSRIPTERYTSQEFLARENKRLWSRVWQVVCREESIPEPGDYLPYRVADQEFLIVRQQDGSLKAFYNVCMHRGNLLRETAGNGDMLRCGYHGWCWHLDGKLADIPDRRLAASVGDGTHGLREIACDRCAGFVFINPAGEEAGSLREFLGEAFDRIQPFRIDRQRLVSWHTLEIACNWKVGIEAFLEAYHVPRIHPQLVTLLDETNTAYERLGIHHHMWIPYGLPSTRVPEPAQQEVYESWLREHFRERHLDTRGASTTQHSSEWEPTFDENGAIVGARGAREYLIARQKAEGIVKGHDYAALTNEQLIDVDHYMFFPNFVFLAKADDTFILRTRPHPTNPDRCTFDVMRLCPPDVRNPEPVAKQIQIDADVATVRKNIGEVISQDFANIVRVQRGLHADALEHVTLTANEVRIRWFHDALDGYLECEG